jgi:hypothetical protein
MNAIEQRLLDLLGMAESPLYSAYRWLDDELGQRLSLSAFLLFLNGLLENDSVRLWSVDHESGDRTELFEVSAGLAERYSRYESLDETYDPFSLSLTLGTAVQLDELPEATWTLDIDSGGLLPFRAPNKVADDALADVLRLLPDLDFVRTEIRNVGQYEVVIHGQVKPATR